MNIKLSKPIKQARPNSQVKPNGIENSDFVESFKNLMAKKKLDSKQSKNDSKDDKKEGLNKNLFLTPYANCPVEKELKTNFPKGSLEELDGENRIGLEGLFKNGELLSGEGLKDTNEEAAISSVGFNFNLEEIKADLNNALGKVSRTLDETSVGGEENLLAGNNLNLELNKSFNLEEGSNLEDIFKDDLGLENLEGGRLGILKEIKTELENFKLENNTEIGSIDSRKELENLSMRDIDAILDKINTSLSLEESLGKVKDIDLPLGKQAIKVDSDTSEDLNPTGTNLIFNRIQDSIVGTREAEEVLSTENLQGVEDSIIKFMKVSNEGDTSTMRVKLYPEELGSVGVSLKLNDGKLIADIVVESEKIKELFLNNSNLLNRNLLEQDIDVKSLNINVKEEFNSFENFHGGLNHRNTGKNKAADPNLSKAVRNNIGNNSLASMETRNVSNQNEGLNILA